MCGNYKEGGVACIYTCQRPTFRKHACMPPEFRERRRPPALPLHPPSLIPLCYRNKVAPWAIPHAVRPSIHPHLPRSSCRSSLSPALSLYAASPFTPPPPDGSIFHRGGLLPYTIYECSPQRSVKAMRYQKEYIPCCTWFAF